MKSRKDEGRGISEKAGGCWVASRAALLRELGACAVFESVGAAVAAAEPASEAEVVTQHD
jgi:hypothetical protein